MSKKTFSGGLNSLLGDQPKPISNVKPKSIEKEISKSSQIGTKENETRATFIVREDLLEKLKAIAYCDRVLIKDIVNKSLTDTIFEYEKKNGNIIPIPKS